MQINPRCLLFGIFLGVFACLGLAGCASKSSQKISAHSVGGSVGDPGVSDLSAAKSKGPPSWSKNKGGYYMDDGPLDITGIDFDKIPEPIPKVEALHRFANRPYNVFGIDYLPQTDLHQSFSQVGTGSWYGRKFHGQKTSSGEIYDMFAMTAAHPTLPIPSYARVTHTRSGKSIVVRVNDRGPFLHQRVIDLSYAAAHRLGYVNDGSAALHVEKLTPSLIAQAQSPGQGFEAVVGASAFENASSVAQAAGGFFLQLGVFSAEANAQALKSRLSLEFSADLPNLTLIQKLPLFRLMAGPYRNREEALSVSLRLKQAAGLNTLLITR